MIEKVVIRNNKRTPVGYLPDLPAFKNGKEYNFKPGVNIIVGRNGSGKTTLMKIIEAYLLVDKNECSIGKFNSNINMLFNSFIDANLLDGADVYADYRKNTFRLCHKDEKNNDDILSSGKAFFEHFEQVRSSTGEGVVMAISSLFNYMYSKEAKLMFDYEAVAAKVEHYSQYGEYVNNHRVEQYDEFTILMDEPDRNLDIDNIEQIKGVFSFHKPHTQIIAVVHNPLLIYILSKNKDVNIIEITDGYVGKISKMVESVKLKKKKL